MTGRGAGDNLNFFTPRGGALRGDVRIIVLVLAGWLAAILGSQLFVYLLEVSYSELLLNELTFFNLPVHFWLTGQFLPLWFIILGALFNIWMDRHAAKGTDGSLRFTVGRTNREGER